MNIVKYFSLLKDNNPSIIDKIFTRQQCVLHITQVGNIIRENRHLFLHKGCFAKYKGYAFSQLHKMQSKQIEEGSNRQELRDLFGFDVKFAMHAVRLLFQVEQILMEQDLDLMKDREQLKAIRRGDIKEEEIIQIINNKESQLEEIYSKSKLREKPDEVKIRDVLLRLEHHYGNLSNAIAIPDRFEQAIREIKKITDYLNL